MENVEARRSDVKEINRPIKTNASETNDEAKADYFSATAGVQAKDLLTQT